MVKLISAFDLSSPNIDKRMCYQVVPSGNQQVLSMIIIYACNGWRQVIITIIDGLDRLLVAVEAICKRFELILMTGFANPSLKASG